MINRKSTAETVILMDNLSDVKLTIWHDGSKSVQFAHGSVIEVRLDMVKIKPKNPRHNSTNCDWELEFDKKKKNAVQLKDGDFPDIPHHGYKCVAFVLSCGESSTLLRCRLPLVFQDCAHRQSSNGANRESRRLAGSSR